MSARLRFLILLLLLLDGFGLLNHSVRVALAMILEHLDEDVRRLEEVAQKRLGETSFVEFLQQHHEQISILHHVKQVVLQNCAAMGNEREPCAIKMMQILQQ